MVIGILMLICNTISPDPTVKTAARVATHTSHLINRTGSLMNTGYGEDLDQELDQEPKYEQKYLQSSSVLGAIQDEYIDEETRSLNRKRYICFK